MKTDGFEKFDGDYNDYAMIALNQAKEKPKKTETKPNSYKLRKERASEINRLSGKIKRGEVEIDRLDAEISKLTAELSTPEVSADYEKVISYTEKIEALTAEQLALMEEWESWNARLTELNDMED